MNDVTILQYFQISMQIVALIVLPPLLVAMVAGLTIAILQAATQIQDQTLPLTIKIVSVGLTMAIFGTALTAPLLEFSRRIFEEFPALTR